MGAEQFDVVVIGAGPAGEVIAGRLASAGRRVAVVEDRLVGGECSYWACMPSKALLRPGELYDETRRVPGVAEAVTAPIDSASVLARRDEVVHDFDDSGQEQWLDDNYFHAPSDETWIAEIEQAVERMRRGELTLRPQFRGSLGGNLRRIWDRKVALGPYDRSLDGYLALAIGLPLRGAVRRARVLRSRLRRAVGGSRPAEAPELTSVR